METIKCSINVFRFICIVITCCMVAFWIEKFFKNEDVSVIEYKYIENADSILLPESTICFWNPFLNSILINISEDVTNVTYRNYLVGGNDTNPHFRKIEFHQVTLDISRYIKSILIGFRPEINKKNEYCTNMNNCSSVTLENNYNGFVTDTSDFMKCFGFRVNKQYSKEVNYLQIYFHETLTSILRQFPGVQMLLNYPGQLLRKKGADQAIWTNPEQDGIFNSFNVDLTEMLIRRDKVNERCLDESKYYDDLVLQKHMTKVGCRAPYHTTKLDFPICTTSRKIKQYVFNGFEKPKSMYLNPCNEMTYLSFKHTTTRLPHLEKMGVKSYPLMIFYPDKIKYVKQSQAIDIHAIIGNIGGYIGLFLGKLLLLRLLNFTYLH